MIFRLFYARQAAVLAFAVGSLALEGCSDHYVISSGLIKSGFQTSAASHDDPKKHQVVIWSNHAEVEQPILQWLEQLQGGAGGNVRMHQSFTEQRSALPLVPHDADILQVARQVGADDAIIAEITIKPAGGAEWFSTYVAVRAFVVATHTMRWSGTAHCARPVKDAEKVVIPLARIAVGIGTGRSADESLLQQDLQICGRKKARAGE